MTQEPDDQNASAIGATRGPKWANRFSASKWTLFADKSMTQVIRVGGIAVIAAVMGIFVFILFQVLPLFGSAEVALSEAIELPPGTYRALALDEWTELPLLVGDDGDLVFVDLTHDNAIEHLKIEELDGQEITSVRYLQTHQQLIYGTASGKFILVDINYQPEFSDAGRRITHQVEVKGVFDVTPDENRIIDLDYNDSGEEKMATAIVEGVNGREIYALILEQKRTMLGAGKIRVGDTHNLTEFITGTPEKVQVNSFADAVIIATQEGEVHYLTLRDGSFTLMQTFRPFQNGESAEITSINYIYGDVSLSFTNADGLNRIFSLYVHEEAGARLFGQTKTFPQLPAGADAYAMSLRNKAFAISSGTRISLRYSTTEQVRWEADAPAHINAIVMPSKYNQILALGDDHNLYIYDLYDPHPEAGYRGYFTKIWYEGYSEPSYDWQSTGGSDDFEPKLSMIPLIIGTLKGTLYAIMFAVPIALLAALYCSQFQKPEHKTFIKPIMEIMASLPSVVLGFLAALWLSPIIETRVPSLLLFVIGLPVSAMFFGWLWANMPPEIRVKIKPGYEYIAFLPVILVVWFISWHLGPVVERMVFVVTDPETGHQVADFRRWWPEFTGARYEQRNALVVGFIMGFAVIPIIFTITEDALSNVPRSMVSGSLALGASRWQTATRVILPTASAGIFSAIMIGLGRAIGETMIVLMATGNTPIKNFNIFEGMRTLSANIAVELPEAPHGGTLFRTLYLGAFLLFIMTFVLNTIAEVLRQHLRNKYKTV